MMTTNKLTKTFASGSLAIGVLAGSVFTATSASAMIMVNWEDFKSGTPISEGDKQVKLTSYVNGGSIDLSNTPSIPVMVIFGDVGGGEYRLSILGEINGPADTFTYEISILPAFPNNYFTGVQLDSDVNVNLANGGYGNVQKRIAELPTLLLTSTNGDPDPFSAFYPIPGGLRTLTVTDSLNPNSGGSLTSLSNKFTQGTKVPEPGTILGLLAVGGLGLVSRFGKQK
jgi:hypothetical protein